MTDAEWAEAHMITSSTGRIYSRSMLLKAASRRKSYTDLLGLTTAKLRAVIDDHAWTRTRRGQTPTSFIDDMIDEAFSRHVAAGPEGAS